MKTCLYHYSKNLGFLALDANDWNDAKICQSFIQFGNCRACFDATTSNDYV